MKTQQRKSASASITPQAAKRYWQATLHRDARADGSFFFAVRSTQIYCRPSCPARRPLRRNTVFFRTPQDAEKEGFRPCQRCRPKQQDSAIALVQRVAAVLARTEEESLRLASLAAQVNSSPAQLRRAFRRADRFIAEGISASISFATVQADVARWQQRDGCAVCLRFWIVQPSV